MVNRMSVSLTEFASMLGSNPMLAITALLTIGVILVNGWTDAPNAIATCVSTRAMKAGAAIAMAAVFNFLGVLVMTMINSRVAMTIYNMVDFGGNEQDATIALCAALFAIVTWATAAWKFGIPTSESHALIAGLSGAAIALHGSFAGINPQEWVKVIYGLVLSTVLGFAAGFGAARLIEWICRRMDRRKTTVFFRGRPDRGRGLHGVHARRARWAKIHERVPAGHLSFQRAGRGQQFRHSHVADDPLLPGDVAGHIHRRIPHHQIRGHGHGAVWRPIRALRRISARRPAFCSPRSRACP